MIRASFRLVITALLLTGEVASAQMCTDVFRLQPLLETSEELFGVRILRDTSSQQITSKRDPRYRQKLRELLMLVTETQFQNISKKDTIDKGELRLGKIFADGMSLEFVYEGDLRKEHSMTLNKIELVKPNGHNETVDKKPLPDFGPGPERRSIVVSSKTIDDSGNGNITLVENPQLNAAFEGPRENLIESDRQKLSTLDERLATIELPYRLDGVILDGLLDWADRVPHVSREIMREMLTRDQVTRLALRSSATRKIKWAGDRLTKGLFGALVVGTVVTSMYQVTDSVKQRIPLPNAHTEQAVQTQAINSREAQLLSSLVQAAEADPAKGGVLINQINSRVREQSSIEINREREEIINLLTELIVKESEQNGSTLIYTGTPRGSTLQLSARARDSELMIAVFPIQQKILIVPDASTSNISAMVLRREQNSQLYDTIAQRIESVYANAPTTPQ